MYSVLPQFEVLTTRYSWTGAKTAQELIAAVAGKRIVIDKIFLTNATSTGVYTFGTGATPTVVGPGTVYQFESKEYNLHLRLPVGQNFSFTTSGSIGAGVIYIEYHLESGTV